MFLRRRRLIAASGLAIASSALPRVAIGQADRRPSITIAVQQISNSASLEPLREQSNVGSRTFSFIFETLIMQNLMGQLEPVPGLAESWKRIDERTVELALRKGVKFHNGDEMTADDVVFTFSRERMFGPDYDITSTKTLFTSVLVRDLVEGKKLPPEVPAVAKRSFPALEKVEAIDKYTVRFTNRTPDVTLEGRIGRLGSDIISRRAYEEAKTWMDWARAPVATGPYKVREFLVDQSLTLDAHDDYWGGRPPHQERQAGRGARSGEPHQRVAVRPVRLHLRRAARPDPGHREERQVRGPGQPDRQSPPDGVRQPPSDAGRSARPPGVQPCDRPPGHRRQPVVGPHAGAGRTAMGILRPDVRRELDGAGLRRRQGQGAPEGRQLQGRPDSLPPAQQLLHQPGGDGAGAGRDVAPGRIERADRDARELAADLRRQRPARGARLVEQRGLQRSDLLDRGPARAAGPAAADRRMDQRGDEQALRRHGDRDRHDQAQGDVQAHAGDLRARGPRLHRAAPERDLHRQAQGHRLEGLALLRDGVPAINFGT